MKKKIIILFISLITLSLLLFLPVRVLILSTQGKTIQIEPFFKNLSFSIRWTHSVEKEDWEEFFLIEDNTIFIESTRFKTFGAGVPNDAGEKTFIKDGWVYMTEIHQSIGQVLHIQTGKGTNHRFQYEGAALSLEPQQSYKIRVQSMPLYQIIFLQVTVQ